MRISSPSLPQPPAHFSDGTRLVLCSGPPLEPRRAVCALSKTCNQLNIYIIAQPCPECDEECSCWCGWSLRFVGLSHGWIQNDGQPKAQKSVLSFIPACDITCDVEDRLLPLPAFEVVDQVCEDFLPLQQLCGDDHPDAQLGQVRPPCVPLRL